jgi:hypothetical protein
MHTSYYGLISFMATCLTLSTFQTCSTLCITFLLLQLSTLKRPKIKPESQKGQKILYSFPDATTRSTRYFRISSPIRNPGTKQQNISNPLGITKSYSINHESFVLRYFTQRERYQVQEMGSNLDTSRCLFAGMAPRSPRTCGAQQSDLEDWRLSFPQTEKLGRK